MDADSATGSGDIAIVGMAVDVPGAEGLEAFWRNLAGGVESIRRLDEDALLAAGERPDLIRRSNYVPAAAPLDGFDMFDAEFFGFNPKEAAILDPQHRKFLEVGWAAMEQAGHTPDRFGGRVGVYAGCGMGSYFYFNICSNPDLVDDVGMFLLRHTGNDKDFMATRVSHVFDLKGPSVNIQTACSTSLVALHYARQALLRGECDMALAGGSTIELPQGRGYQHKENEILSPDGHCHAFDHRAQGTVFGSGAGCVALRRLSDAVADGDHVWAVIKGSAINNDGAAKAGYLAPSVDGQAQAVAAALRDADVPADTVDYVECHGTGTYLGDPIEVAALTEAYRQTTQDSGYCRIGSVKTNIGHLDTAAGIVSLIKTALALNHRQIPPSLGYEAPNPAIDFDNSPFSVNAALRDWSSHKGPRRAGVNSLGVGGTNAHVVLEEAPARAPSEEPDFPFQVLCLSARSKSALAAQSSALAAHLRAHPDQPLADVAFTLKEGRRGFDKRRVLVAETHEEAADLLESGDPPRVFDHDRLADAPEVVFLFPGGGAQYPYMARDLYETEPVFAEWMDRGLAHLQPQLDYDIRALWLPDPDRRADAAETLKKPSVQLPLIMITEYALAQLWLSWGVRPAALVGHSMGENTAACLAGVMRFEDCIDLVLLRGRLFDGVAPGGMLSVSLSLDDLEPLIGEDLDIASVNAPGLCAVSGPQAALDDLAQRLTTRGVDFQRVNIDIAAHSRMLDPILSDFRAFLAELDLQPPQIPIRSNRTGADLGAAEATDPDYWVQQLRRTVRFADCIAALSDRPRVFLEVGPGKALSSLARMSEGVKPGQVLSSLRHPDEEVADDAYFLGVIGRLWACGVAADWTQIWGEARRNRVVLPTYAFQRNRYFIEPGQSRAAAEPALARAEDMAEWGWRPVWVPRLPDCEWDVAGDLSGLAPQTWLIFEDEAGLAATLTDRLRAAGQVVTTVRAGDSFARLSDAEYVLAPEQGAEVHEALLSGLAQDGRLPQRIAHFWLVGAPGRFRPGSSPFDHDMEHGFYSLLHLAQAMAGVEMPAGAHLDVFTSDAAQVRHEALRAPARATVLGPVGTIPREFPGVTAAWVDLALPEPARQGLRERLAGLVPADPRAALDDALMQEVLASPANRIAAWRGAARFEQVIRPAALPEAGAGAAGFVSGGTYLITGGFGGIGLSVARHLAAAHGARIALVSRAAVPPRTEWDSYAGSGPTARRIAALQEIEAAGGQVMVVQADVTDIAAMQQARARVTDAFGPINGVIHAAGLIDDAPLLSKDAAGVQAVLSPKIDGLQVIDQVFPDGGIDLLVLFSSTSTLTRPAGQVDYIAANAYLDAYAQSRVGGRTQVRAIDWGVWAEVGMAAQAMAEATGTAQPDRRRLNLPLLDSVEQRGDVTAFHGTLEAPGDWVVNEHRTKGGDMLLPGTGYIELAAQAVAARGGWQPFELRDLAFLRPLDVAPGHSRDIALRLEGGTLEFRSAAEAGGQKGTVLNAQALLQPLQGAVPAPLDTGAIAARCGRALPLPFVSPQEAHLRFGPRWRVVERAHFGAGEGLAHLRLPEAARGDPDAGWLMHPALLDLATGWAVALHPGYDPARLWAPVGYDRMRVWAPLPERVLSWVRLAPQVTDSDMIAFDVTICDPAGAVCIGIEGFQMRRLAAEGFAMAPLSAQEIDAEAQDTAQAAPGRAQERLIEQITLGIRPDEGPLALERALALALPRVAVSSLALPALIEAAGQTDEAAPQGGQSFERPDLDSDYTAPRDATETRLAGIWQGLLGIDRIGVEDSFFDLGGHSLLAVRLFAQIKRDFGVQFPISVLFEAPTIEKIAARLPAPADDTGAAQSADTAPDSPEYRHLVALSPGGAQTPLFIVAGMFGNVLNLRHLALLTGRARPVWGLQARGLIGEEAPHATIEAAAADYIAEMRQVQPEGPYCLGGFSGGGITAYEMAQQLRAAGQEVAVLAMLDTPLPVRPTLTRPDKALIKMHELRRKGPRYLAEWARNRLAWEIARRRGDAAPQEAGAFNDAAIEAAFRQAVAQYRLRPWDGPMTLFRPPLDRHWKVTGGNWVSREREYVYDDNQWTPFVPALEVIEVPGDHDSMVLVPNVSVLARHLGALMDAADHGRRAAHDTARPDWAARPAAE